MRRIVWLRAATLVAIAALAGAAAVQAADTPKSHTGHRGFGRLQERLGLTDQQVQTLQQIHEREAEAWKQHRQAVRQARSELRRLILAQADEPSIEAKQTELQQLMAAEIEMRARHLREITPVLTPEQREKFAELAEKRGHGPRRHRPRS